MKSKYHTLILEGGGVKGYAYPFVLQELETKGVVDLKGFSVFAGSSAGAITAALLACGATPKKLARLLNIDFGIFKDDKPGIFWDVWNIIRHWGYCEGKAFEEWFKGCLDDLKSCENITFDGLKAVYGKELHITATNLSKGCLEVFNYKTTPCMPIWLAVRASMAIPIFFRPVSWRGAILVDGGVLRNYYDLPGDGGELGIRLVNDDDYRKEKRKEIKSVFGLMNALIATMMHSSEQQHISKSLWKNTISVNTKDIQATDFDLSDKQKHTLKKESIKAVNLFCERLR